MSPRVALNMVYAHLVTGLDSKQRKEFDDELYGWRAENERATQLLQRRLNSGGEDE